jgi:hypothetical protein
MILISLPALGRGRLLWIVVCAVDLDGRSDKTIREMTPIDDTINRCHLSYGAEFIAGMERLC